MRLPLRVVFYKEDGDWIAHCLELDVIGDGTTEPAALQSLAGAVDAQLEFLRSKDAMDSLLRPAEAKIFRMYAEGRDVAGNELTRVAAGMKSNPLIESVDWRLYDGETARERSTKFATA